MIRRIALAATVMVVVSINLFAEQSRRGMEERGGAARCGHTAAQVSVFIRYDPQTGGVDVLQYAPPFDHMVDMNPAEAVKGTYAVIVTRHGSSFVVPALVAVVSTGTYVVLPFSTDWEVSSLTVHNVPDRSQALQSFGVSADLLEPDETAVKATPRGRFKVGAEWCLLPQYTDVSQFETAGGGRMCINCVGCFGGPEFCGNWHHC